MTHALVVVRAWGCHFATCRMASRGAPKARRVLVVVIMLIIIIVIIIIIIIMIIIIITMIV